MPIVGDRPEITVNAVIFATDFSSCSENAGRYAHQLAKHFPSKLFVAHAFLLTQPAQEAEQHTRTHSQQRKDLEMRLARRAGELASGVQQSVPTLLEGNPHEVIPALAEDHSPAITVLGTHGAGRIEHELLGSTAEKILRSSRWPCLTVGPHVPQPPTITLPFHRILYATDFTPAAANAAVYALTFAEASGGNIDTMNVIPQTSLRSESRLAELRAGYFHVLDQQVPQHARDFCNPHTFIEDGNAHDRILEHIREHEIDLLVLGVRKTSHLGLTMRTSGAFRLIAGATCPVLTIAG